MISYSEKKEYLDSTGIKIFELKNFKILNDNDKNYTYMNGVYFPIRYRHQFISLLQDYIAGYLKYKKIYPELKIIFFTDNWLESNPKNYLRNQKFLDDLVFHFNSEIINISNNNYIFDKIILHEVEMTVIPREIYHSGSAPDEFSKEVKQWRIEAIPLIYEEFKKYIKQNNNINLYISRSKINKQWMKFTNDKYLQSTRVHNKIFDDDLDNMLSNIGFKVLDFFNFGFFDQINMSYNSNIYLSIDGSSLINAIWSNNNCKIIKIIVNKNYKNMNYYWEEQLNSVGKYFYKVIDVSEMSPKNAIEHLKNVLVEQVGLEPTTTKL